MANNEKIVYVKEKHGFLMTVVTFLLFGWIGLAAVAFWKALKWTWRWLIVFPSVWLWKLGVAYPLIWLWRGCVALWQVGMRASAQRRGNGGDDTAH